MYNQHSDTFDRDAAIIKSSNNELLDVQDLPMFFENVSSRAHLSWRINRMLPARVVRTLFPRPYIISEWSGQSIERYITMSMPNAPPHKLPNFECSNVFVVQGSGEQMVVLRPTHECVDQCRTISIVLKPSYVCK